MHIQDNKALKEENKRLRDENNIDDLKLLINEKGAVIEQQTQIVHKLERDLRESKQTCTALKNENLDQRRMLEQHNEAPAETEEDAPGASHTTSGATRSSAARRFLNQINTQDRTNTEKAPSPQ